jgi:hypothetical protein
LRKEGWSDEELDQMLADKEEERQANTQSLAVALLNQQRAFDQGGQQPQEGPPAQGVDAGGVTQGA